jgi:hypothetical protein
MKTDKRKGLVDLYIYYNCAKECFMYIWNSVGLYDEKDKKELDKMGKKVKALIEKFDKILDFKEGSHTGICNVIDTDYSYKNSFWRSFKADKISVNKKAEALKECVKVIDITTDVIYDSISQAAKANNIRPSNLQKKLQGKRRNNTNLRYYGK